MKHIGIIAVIAAIACGAACAQSSEGQEKKLRAEIVADGVATARFGMMGPTVKGAPYAADGITEVTQTLGDGTHINRTETYTIYRDGEGRIRRESGGEVWISDPVAGASYVLDTKQQTARRMPLSKTVAFQKLQLDKAQAGMMSAKLKAEGHAAAAGFTGVIVRDGGYMVNFTGGSGGQDKAEALGKQAMEGVEVEGTRNTTVIPEGQIGNDRPLQMVHERWESAELHVTILAKHTDPMMGDRVERLTNVRRGEPDPALFQVPAAYQIESEK